MTPNEAVRGCFYAIELSDGTNPLFECTGKNPPFFRRLDKQTILIPASFQKIHPVWFSKDIVGAPYPVFSAVRVGRLDGFWMQISDPYHFVKQAKYGCVEHYNRKWERTDCPSPGNPILVIPNQQLISRLPPL